MTEEDRTEHQGSATESDSPTGGAGGRIGFARWAADNGVAGDRRPPADLDPARSGPNPLDPFAGLPPVKILTPPPPIASRAELVAWFRAQADRIESEGCTGVSAQWCPIHGTCSCVDREDAMDDNECPLHRRSSSHAAGAEHLLFVDDPSPREPMSPSARERVGEWWTQTEARLAGNPELTGRVEQAIADGSSLVEGPGRPKHQTDVDEANGRRSADD